MATNKDFLFMIRRFCEEENLQKTVHMLEQETGCFFDMKYYEGLVLNGNWNEAENYLSGFTAILDNEMSYTIYFELRKQKYLEALERHDVARALDILATDLKVFTPSNEVLYREMTSLMTMEDFRNHRLFCMYGDTQNARKNTWNNIKHLIGVNPLFHNKLESPQIDISRVWHLVNQRVERQQVQSQTEPQPSRTMPVEEAEAMLVRARLCQPSVLNLNITTSSTTNCVTIPNQAGSSSRGCNTSLDNNMAPIQNVNLMSNLFTDLPQTVKRCMNMRAASTSMDFHPINETLLLVGNSGGEIEVWDVRLEVRLFGNGFSIWRRDAISVNSLNDIDRDRCVYINRVLWSPDGLLFGVAYSKHMIQLYAYHVQAHTTQKHLEIDSHHGSVNDLAFSSQEDKLFVISCGDDTLIQVWDVMTGSKQYTFEGHTAPVHSLYPQLKKDIHVVFSTSRNGEVKAWVYENSGPKVEFMAPKNFWLRMAYTADGQRLFSCGSNKNGESSILEWHDADGYVIHTYKGLSDKAVGIVQFSICRNQYIAAGDDHLIKVWNVDKNELLTIIEAEGGLPACPRLCFNKTGTLLAVSADNNKVKILANDVGQQILQNSSCLPPSVGPSGNFSNFLQNLATNTSIDGSARTENGGSARTVRPNRTLDSQKRLIPLNASNCRSLRLPSDVNTSKICRLIYTHTGNEVLALAADGIHLLWRWLGTGSNNFGWATTNYAPQLYRPQSGQLMTNELNNDNSRPITPFLALTRNDSYLMSGSGSHVSLFSTVTFQKLGSYVMAPPVATCISYYPPDNNIIAVGMDDSTILIYNTRQSEVINKLQGHENRVSGLIFSTRNRVLVSAGVDTQIIVWDYNRFLKKHSIRLEVPTDWLPSETAETVVQFFRDQKNILAVHETQLAIYETTHLARSQKWTDEHLSSRISHATLSSDDMLIFAVLRNRIILIFYAWGLLPAFHVDPSIYLPRNPSVRVDPLVVAGNPQKPSQFAVGLSDGGVVVIEPLEGIGRRLTQQSVENGLRWINRPIMH